MSRLRVGVVGVGHLGRHHARILAGLDGVELAGVVDSRREQAEAVAASLGTRALTNYHELLPLVDAVSVVVPTVLHGEVAGYFLQRGIHCLVEKPLASTLTEAQQLVAAADKSGAILQVGHIERFNPAFACLVESGLRPRYLTAERLGVYTFRSTDISVVFDLMIHDIDLVLTLVNQPIRSVSALGASLFGGHEDVAQSRLEFADGTVVDLAASRVSQQPSRRLRLWSPDGYASVDFSTRQTTILRPSEALQRGEANWDGVDRTTPDSVREHIFGRLLHVEHSQPTAVDALTLELKDFVVSIATHSRPKVTGGDGARAVALAEHIQSALRSKGPIQRTGYPSHPAVSSRVPPPKLWRRRGRIAGAPRGSQPPSS